jgi:hypothetical protein
MPPALAPGKGQVGGGFGGGGGGFGGGAGFPMLPAGQGFGGVGVINLGAGFGMPRPDSGEVIVFYMEARA